MKRNSKFKIVSLWISGALAIPSILSAQDPQPLDLSTALDLALKNNFSILTNEAELAKVQGTFSRVRSGTLPKLELIYNYNRIDDNLLESFGGSSFGSDQSWSVDLQLTQAIFHGRRDLFAIDREEARIAAIKAKIEETLLDVVFQTKTAWYQLVLARELIEVQEKSNQLLKEELERSRDRYELGSLSRFELLRAEVALANSNPPLIKAKNDYRIAIVDLYRIIGLPAPDLSTSVAADSLSAEPFNISFEEALEVALRQRPQLTLLEKQAEALAAQVDYEKTAYWPNLDFVAGYGIQKSSFSDRLGDTVEGWTVGVQGSWNLWDSGNRKGRIIEAQSDLRAADLQIDEFELQMELEIRRALSDLEEAKELVNASQKVVEQAEEALKLAKDRYDVGSAIQLDLLDAEVALTEARTNAIQARFDFNVAKAKIEREIGIRSLIP